MPGITIPSLWLHCSAGFLVIALGIAYILRSAPLADTFKLILAAHRRTLIMALVSQGILLCFIGTVIIITRLVSPDTALSRALSFVCAGLLLIVSVWTGSTGARSEYFLLGISHFVTILAAGFVLLGCAQG
jgi:hypothetical protein